MPIQRVSDGLWVLMFELRNDRVLKFRNFVVG